MKNGGGWIKLYRSVLESPATGKTGHHLAVAAFLLLSASIEPETAATVTTSISAISSRLKISVDIIRSVLAEMERAGFISCKANAHRSTTISICNFKTYQYGNFKYAENIEKQTPEQNPEQNPEQTIKENQQLNAFSEKQNPEQNPELPFTIKEEVLKNLKKEITRKKAAGETVNANLEAIAARILTPEALEEYTRWKIIWAETYNGGRPMTQIVEIGHLQILARIPEDLRTEAVTTAADKRYKNIYDPRALNSNSTTKKGTPKDYDPISTTGTGHEDDTTYYQTRKVN